MLIVSPAPTWFCALPRRTAVGNQPQYADRDQQSQHARSAGKYTGKQQRVSKHYADCNSLTKQLPLRQWILLLVTSDHSVKGRETIVVINCLFSHVRITLRVLWGEMMISDQIRRFVLNENLSKSPLGHSSAIQKRVMGKRGHNFRALRSHTLSLICFSQVTTEH